MLPFLFVFTSCDNFILDKFWVRSDSNTVTHNYDNNGGSFVYAGTGLFHIESKSKYNVKVGQMYSFKTQIAASESKNGTIFFSYVGYDAKKKAYYEESYIYFKDRSGNFADYEISFCIVNPDIVEIAPRISGFGPIDLKYKIVTITKGTTFEFDPKITDQVIETDKIKFTFYKDNFTFDIYDKLSKRTYKQTNINLKSYFIPSIKKQGDTINITVVKKWVFSYSYIIFTVSNNEVRLELQQDHDKQFVYKYPGNIPTESTDQLIIPVSEGMIIPVNQNLSFQLYLQGSTGYGCVMQFFAVARYDENGSGKEGYICIIETSDDYEVVVTNDKQTKNSISYVNWLPQKGKVFGYNRVLKYVIFNDGGHVAATKIYKEYVTKTGRRVTFLQKAEKNPALLETYKRLQGAAHIWTTINNQTIYEEMKNVYNWTNLLISDTYGSFIEWAKTNGYVPSHYDIYQDAVDPALKSQFNWSDGWVDDAYANDELVLNEDGSRKKGWGIFPLDGGPMQYADMVSDKFWPKYMRQRLDKEINKGVKRPARYIDTTTATAWFEDYHPKHPSNRTLSRHQRYVALELLHNEYGLVVGSEEGHDSMIGVADYFQGIMSINLFRVKKYGRYPAIIINDPDENIIKYQVGERYRVPLWELVYHDCAIAYTCAGDHNNKIPSIWHKRDLFNALYGVPPVYLLNKKESIWDELKTRMNESYHIATETAKHTMFAEMIDHKILTKDWSVQQCIFSNSVRSTVNFGSSDFKMKDGYKLKAGTSRVELSFDDSESSGNKTKTIVGVVCALIVVAIVVTIAVIIVMKRKSTKQKASDDDKKGRNELNEMIV